MISASSNSRMSYWRRTGWIIILRLGHASFFRNVNHDPRADQRQVRILAAMQNTVHGEAASREPCLPAAGCITILDRLLDKFTTIPENGALQLLREPENKLNRLEAGEKEHDESFPDGQMDMDETDIMPPRLEDPPYFIQSFPRVQKMLHDPYAGNQVKVVPRKRKAFS